MYYVKTRKERTLTKMKKVLHIVGTMNLGGQEAFIMNLGSLGNIVVILSIILFAFSTVLSGYYDGEASLKSIFPNISKNKLLILKIVTFVVILFVSITKANLIWSFVNILTSLLAIINSYALIKLYKEVVFEYKRYNKCGKIK